ncbi:MAG: Eco57I restriction-modification methylase domain-containing protein [Coriobacteriales bacterium]|nr:Eco57I restriction-modification methylase domain-containing protein [Coriobacteriales bacterium]
MGRVANGVVFTKNWVVELMLDCCGYLSHTDLATKLVIEPACGQGAFLFPIVSRLLDSALKHGHEFSELASSIRAFELNKDDLDVCHKRLYGLLREVGVGEEVVADLLDAWLVHSDYLLHNTEQVADYVVGNPPYIRGTEIDWELRQEYAKSCKTMTAGTDIYVGFIEAGLRSLKPNGVLSFICADRWMHNAYGKRLRKMVTQGFSVDIVLLMHGVDAFEDKVAAYPAITQIKNAQQGETAFVTMRESFSEDSLPELHDWLHSDSHSPFENSTLTGYRLHTWCKTDEAWPLASPKVISLLEELNARYHPLQNDATKTRVGIGIATGRDDVFVIEDPSLVEDCLLLPLVTSRQTRSGKIERQGVWLFNPWDEAGNLIDIDRYPLAKSYLADHEYSLRTRHIAMKSGEHGWYRTIDKVYPGLIDKPKLLIQDMKSSIQPVYDRGEYYPHHNLYWITSEQWDLEALGGLLMSETVRMIVAAYCVKMRGGTLRLQAQFLRKIRLPDPGSIDDSLQDALIDAFRRNDREKASEAALMAFKLER